jgi:hypothetical protein
MTVGSKYIAFYVLLAQIFSGQINGPFFDSMKNPIELLFNLQTLELAPDAQSPDNAAEILRLRQKIPTPILAHYDRMRARDKKGVALVRNSVCSECHMRLASGIAAALLRAEDVMICDTCGRYLHIVKESVSAIVAEPEPPKAPARKRRKKAATPESAA